MKHVTEKKTRDKAVIEALVRNHGPISRAEIRQLTQLRWSTISPIVRDLLNEGKVREIGPSSNPTGRKQTLLQLNDEHGFIVAVGFDPETVSAAVTNLVPRIKSKVSQPTCVDGGAEGLVRQLFSCVHQAIREAGIEREKILGIAAADPGLVNTRDGISILASNLGFWKNIPLKKLFTEEFGIPFILESSTRAQALAERVLGAGGGADDMVYIEFGKGIGAGIVIDGKMLCGHNWIAGEFGHIPVVENGPACSCGSFGCLEAVVGVSALEARCRRALQEGAHSRVLDIVNGEASRITGWTVFQAAKLGDKTCMAIIEELEKYLGLGLATLVNLFNPSVVVLDHRLELGGESLLDQVARVVRKQALGDATGDLRFRYATLAGDAGLLGAALNVLERSFEIPLLKPPRFMVESSVVTALAANRRAWAQNSEKRNADPELILRQ